MGSPLSQLLNEIAQIEEIHQQLAKTGRFAIHQSLCHTGERLRESLIAAGFPAAEMRQFINAPVDQLAELTMSWLVTMDEFQIQHGHEDGEAASLFSSMAPAVEVYESHGDAARAYHEIPPEEQLWLREFAHWLSGRLEPASIEIETLAYRYEDVRTPNVVFQTGNGATMRLSWEEGDDSEDSVQLFLMGTSLGPGSCHDYVVDSLVDVSRSLIGSIKGGQMQPKSIETSLRTDVLRHWLTAGKRDLARVTSTHISQLDALLTNVVMHARMHFSSVMDDSLACYLPQLRNFLATSHWLGHGQRTQLAEVFDENLAQSIERTEIGAHGSDFWLEATSLLDQMSAQFNTPQLDKSQLYQSLRLSSALESRLDPGDPAQQQMWAGPGTL